MVMGVASIFGVFAGTTTSGLAKMTGRMMNETLGQLHFWLNLHRHLLHFHAVSLLGLVGNVRRYSAFVNDFTGR